MRNYRTIQGDTWDVISYRCYPSLGGERIMSDLMAANPDYIHTVIFPAGVVLNIPEIETPSAAILPPWVD